MEIIDAQIHEPQPTKPVDPELGEAVSLLVNVEIAREAIDCVGVDAALVFARTGMLAGRNLVGNARDATLRPEFEAGAFERLYAAAEKHDLPLFFSTHTNEIGPAEKELIFGKTIRRVLRWPKAA